MHGCKTMMLLWILCTVLQIIPVAAQYDRGERARVTCAGLAEQCKREGGVPVTVLFPNTYWNIPLHLSIATRPYRTLLIDEQNNTFVSRRANRRIRDRNLKSMTLYTHSENVYVAIKSRNPNVENSTLWFKSVNTNTNGGAISLQPQEEDQPTDICCSNDDRLLRMIAVESLTDILFYGGECLGTMVHEYDASGAFVFWTNNSVNPTKWRLHPRTTFRQTDTLVLDGSTRLVTSGDDDDDGGGRKKRETPDEVAVQVTFENVKNGSMIPPDMNGASFNVCGTLRPGSSLLVHKYVIELTDEDDNDVDYQVRREAFVIEDRLTGEFIAVNVDDDFNIIYENVTVDGQEQLQSPLVALPRENFNPASARLGADYGFLQSNTAEDITFADQRFFTVHIPQISGATPTPEPEGQSDSEEVEDGSPFVLCSLYHRQACVSQQDVDNSQLVILPVLDNNGELPDRPSFIDREDELLRDFSAPLVPGITKRLTEFRTTTLLLDVCLGNPCNEGTCTRNQRRRNTYDCACPEGQTGRNCEFDIEECIEGVTCFGQCLDGICAICTPGFAGPACADDIDECEGDPCLNGGVCVNEIGAFRCNCPREWMGLRCENEVIVELPPTVPPITDSPTPTPATDYCSSNPCSRGVCINGPSTFGCECPAGFTGLTCDTGDYCSSNPCSRGVCINGQSTFECDCPAGYTGLTCDTDIDECEEEICEAGECINTPGSYTCECPPGRVGQNCEQTGGGPCGNQPCINGYCIANSAVDFVCICPDGYTGTLCQTVRDPCVSNPCSIGICVQTEGGFACRCPPGMTGVFCDQEICDSNPCVNGLCDIQEGRTVCICPPGFSGPLCENVVDPCFSNPCVYGTCFSNGGSVRCTCEPGKTGVFCDRDICESNPCVNGFCAVEGRRTICVCPEGYAGQFCQILLDPCLSNPCEFGTCSANVGSFTCECLPGKTGPRCDTDICKSNPCVNGFCEVRGGLTICVCPEGYRGQFCQILLDPCFSDPCEFGTCSRTPGGEGTFTCECLPGKTGPLCDTDICSSNPCVNGYCDVSEDGTFCVCPSGYGGEFCQLVINACASNPCIQGECANIGDTFTCRCNAGFTGIFCNTDIDECTVSPNICGTSTNNATCSNTIGSFECLLPVP